VVGRALRGWRRALTAVLTWRSLLSRYYINNVVVSKSRKKVRYVTSFSVSGSYCDSTPSDSEQYVGETSGKYTNESHRLSSHATGVVLQFILEPVLVGCYNQLRPGWQMVLR